MAKPTVFLDCDGLIFNTVPAHVEYINQRHGVFSEVKDYLNNSNDLHLVVNKYRTENYIEKEEFYTDLVVHFLPSHDYHKTVSIFPGATRAIRDIKKKNDIVISTSRPRSGIHVVEELCKKFIPDCISEIHCVHEFEGGKRVGEFSKRDFIIAFPGPKKGFADDSAKEILATQDIIPSYLFDPSKVNHSHPGIQYVVHSWQELRKIFCT